MTTQIHSKKLIQLNRSTFISFDEEYRIQHIPFVGGKSAFIISKKINNMITAIADAPTLEEAQAKYFSMVKAVA